MPHRILALNPAATSTKISLFDDEEAVLEDVIRHGQDELSAFDRVWDQYFYRKDRIEEILRQKGIEIKSLSAVAGRGGLLKPIPGGTYEVNSPMLEDLRRGIQGEHASNLGGLLAYGLARSAGIPAYIVDPVAVDEMEPVARYTGLPEIQRRSLIHALNLRAEARRAAAEMGKEYEDCSLVVVHLGVGISVTPHRRGRIIDSNNANEGGPFSPERAGTLPIGDLVRACFSGKYSERELIRKLTSEGGLYAHLGTKDIPEVERRVEQGDPVATLVYEAMGYQVAKEIGAMAAVLSGEVDAIVLTGPLAASERLVGWVKGWVDWMAPVMVYPGSDEMRALAAGALRVLRGEETVKVYH